MWEQSHKPRTPLLVQDITMDGQPGGASLARQPKHTSIAHGVAHLKAEIQRLQAQNDDLAQQLEQVNQRLPGCGRLLVTGTRHVYGGSVAVEDLLLTEAEVEEAAMRAAWLSHYWGLASELDVCSPCVALEKATYWQQVAPPAEVLQANAARVAAQVLEWMNVSAYLLWVPRVQGGGPLRAGPR